MAGMNRDFSLSQSILDAYQQGGSAADELFRDTSGSPDGIPGDTGWISVGSSRVREIRWVPTIGTGRDVSTPGSPFMPVSESNVMSYTGNLFVRFIKYDTAYVYRGVSSPTFNVVDGFGQRGSGIGSYINHVLDGFTRDYCTQTELDLYFGGYGGSYRGPSGHPTPGA